MLLLILCFMFILILELIAYALVPSAHERGEVRRGICLFLFLGPPCCFRLDKGSLRNL